METFETKFPRVAGLDVHQAQVTACVRVRVDDAKVWAHSDVFATTPAGLRALGDWLATHRVTHAAMEGTGVYWLPVYTALEARGVDLTLCNAHHVKQIRGRKTDQSDAAWLAQLLAAGLLTKSFVPPAAVRALRELTRARVHRVEDRGRVVNGLHRLLERAGVKLCSVVSDLQGVTARAILRALVAGATDAAALAALARGTLRRKQQALADVLGVPLSALERLLLGQGLAQLDLLDAQIAALDAEITAATAPYATVVTQLRTIGGLDAVAAAAIVAEIGVDMTAWAGGPQMAAWAGVAPGSHESAGKRRHAGARRGNTYLQRILVQVAMVLSRSKRPHDLADFFRAKLPRGYKKALVAVAHKLLLRIRTMIERGTTYAPPPKPPLTAAQRGRAERRAVERLNALGYKVTLEPVAA